MVTIPGGAPKFPKNTKTCASFFLTTRDSYSTGQRQQTKNFGLALRFKRNVTGAPLDKGCACGYTMNRGVAWMTVGPLWNYFYIVTVRGCDPGGYFFKIWMTRPMIPMITRVYVNNS